MLTTAKRMIIKVPNPIFGFHLGKVKNIKRPENGTLWIWSSKPVLKIASNAH